MTSKELVYRALAFEKVPRVPYTMGFTSPARQAMEADPRGRELLARLDADVVSTPVIRIEYGVRDEHGLYEDEFGVVWDRTMDIDIGIPRPVVTRETLDAYRWPDPARAGRFDRLIENVRRQPEKFHLLAVDFSLYERAWTLRGLENLLLDFVEAEEFAGRLLDRVLEFNLRLIEAGLRACPGIDGVYFGDDFGSQRGLIMGGERWRRLIKPRLARQYGAVKSAGKKVFIHSCGKVQELFDDLAEIGVDCFNPFQPEVMDVYALFDRYRGRLAFHGGVSTQRLLPYGKVSEVQAEVGRLLKRGRQGGYIIAPAHGIPGDAKVENMCVMIEMITEQG